MKVQLKLVFDHWKDCKLQIHWKNVICNTNKTRYQKSLLLSSKKLFLKDVKQYNH